MLSLFYQHEQLIQLGTGGFGEVWKVRIISTNQILAAKYLKNVSLETLDCFRREIRLLQELNSNPYIVRFYGANLNCDKPYILMEYCAGGNLRQYIKKFKSSDVLNILYCLAKALESIHETGGFHRDIKPDNILFSQTDNGMIIPKLSDFGVARTPHPNSLMTYSGKGTIPYMAPEILQGGEYTQKADIYSLGLSCIEIFVGTPDRSKLLPQIPLDIRGLLLEMTDNNPAQRPSLRVIEKKVTTLMNIRSNAIQQIVSDITIGDIALSAGIGILGAILIGNKK